jgi:hypothetical protein
MVEHAMKLLVGKRGSTVKILLERAGAEGGGGGGHALGVGGQATSQEAVEVTLKRGAWGAEHAVVDTERRDMRDLARWPPPIV